jgi:hypothetical protein
MGKSRGIDPAMRTAVLAWALMLLAIIAVVAAFMTDRWGVG